MRGRILGAECLAEVLGPLVPVQDTRLGQAREPAVNLMGLGFLAALVGSVLPWTTFGVGSGSFGGWGYSPLRWSLMAAAAAAVGMASWLATRWMGGPDRGTGMAFFAVLAALVAAGAILHALRPPPFTHPSLGPWVALAGGSIALAGVVWLVRERYLLGRPRAAV